MQKEIKARKHRELDLHLSWQVNKFLRYFAANKTDASDEFLRMDRMWRQWLKRHNLDRSVYA